MLNHSPAGQVGRRWASFAPLRVSQSFNYGLLHLGREGKRNNELKVCAEKHHGQRIFFCLRDCEYESPPFLSCILIRNGGSSYYTLLNPLQSAPIQLVEVHLVHKTPSYLSPY